MNGKIAGIVIALLLAGFINPVKAADTYSLSYGASQEITEHSVCRKVTNNHASGLPIMVPTQTATEWSSFYSASMSGVTVAECQSCALPYDGAEVTGSSAWDYTPTGVIVPEGHVLESGRVVRFYRTACTEAQECSYIDVECKANGKLGGVSGSTWYSGSFPTQYNNTTCSKVACPHLNLGNTRYACNTPNGTVYYRYVGVGPWGYGPGDESAFGIVASGDFANGDDSTTACKDPGNIAYRPIQRSKCAFFADKTGRWNSIVDGIYPETAALPDSVTTQITISYDCGYYPLQPSITPEICNAQYTCTKETF